LKLDNITIPHHHQELICLVVLKKACSIRSLGGSLTYLGFWQPGKKETEEKKLNHVSSATQILPPLTYGAHLLVVHRCGEERDRVEG